MSLLDDVSIVVTPNGYKAGELYAAIPVPTEGAEEVPSIIGILNAGGGTITQISGNSYSSTSDGTSGSGIRPKFDFNTTAGKRYKLTITPTGTISGTINFDFYDGSSYLFQNYDFTTTKEIYFIDNGSVFGAFDGAKTYDVSSFTVSVKEYTSADMDVTRATAATRVDENGLVNYAEIIGGEEVTNGDFATDLSGWTGQAGRGSYAWDNGKAKITNDDTSGYPNLSQSVTTVSGKVYKVNATVEIGTATLTEVRAYSGGVLGSQQLNTDGTIDFTFTAIGTSFTLHLYLFEAGNTGNYCFFDNVSVKEVTRDNVPRIDYTGGGCPHILAEPQRTNLVTHSSDFSNAVWSEVSGGSASNPVLTNDYAISPDGTQNATRCLFDMGGGTTISDFSRLRYLNLTATTPLISIYIKSNNATTYQLNLSYGGDALFLVDAKPNEWTRVDKLTTASGSFDYRLELRGTKTSDDIADVLIWGAQAEEGSYGTSYIPTSGSTVTRNQDIFTRDGIGSLINSTEGVLFVELSFSQSGRLSLTDSTGANQVVLGFISSIFFRIVEAGSSVITESFSSASELNRIYKVAIKYKDGDSAIWVDGVEEVRTESFTLTGLSEIAFSSQGNTFYGKVKQLQVYDTALTDTQLAALTS